MQALQTAAGQGRRVSGQALSSGREEQGGGTSPGRRAAGETGAASGCDRPGADAWADGAEGADGCGGVRSRVIPYTRKAGYLLFV
jgi:hypothetical protein